MTMTRHARFGLLALCLALGACDSDQGWEVHELGTDAEFKDIFFLDDDNGWIVGGGYQVQGGVIGRTRDGGLTWRFQSGLVPKRSGVSSYRLHAIEFLDEWRGCVVGAGGHILVTEDGGETWRRVRVGGRVSAHLFDLDFVDQEYGWAVGLDGVLGTRDGGQTWKRLDDDRYLDGWAIQFLDRERGWIVGQFGDVRRSDDGGITWQRVQALGPEEKPFLTSLHFPDPEHGWIVGEGGIILGTADGGETWVHQDSGVDAFLTSVHFLDARRGWAVGYRRSDGTSDVLHTEDGGQVWSVQTTVFGEELGAVFVRGAYGWAVGDRSRKEPQKLLRQTRSPDPARDLPPESPGSQPATQSSTSTSPR